jgi:membrane-bound ClpP family serine protease
MTRIARYVLFQIPAWVGLLVLVAWLWPLMGWPLWSGVLVLTLWTAKDVALYPLVRSAYDPASAPDPARVCGRSGILAQDLAPEGYLRLGAELWRARSSDGRPIPRGSLVRVESVRGLTVSVVVVQGSASEQ